jgi:hypothetical protein
MRTKSQARECPLAMRPAALLLCDADNTRTSLMNSCGAISCDPVGALGYREAPVTGRWELRDEKWSVMEPVLRPPGRGDNRGALGMILGLF